MVALGREGFLTASELLDVIRKLADGRTTVALGGTRRGTLALDEVDGAFIVSLNEQPAILLVPATARGGWLSAPNKATDRWLVDVDLHGDGCKMLIDQLRFHRSTQVSGPV